MSTESEYLATRMNLGIFKSMADVKDKYNMETIKMAEGYLAANATKYDEGLMFARQLMNDRQEKLRVKI